MTGKELAKLADDLQLNDAAIRLISGGSPGSPGLLDHMRDWPDPIELSCVIPPLGCDILTALWGAVDTMTAEEKRGLGVSLAKDLHVHGPGHVAWRILNTRCSSWAIRATA